MCLSSQCEAERAGDGDMSPAQPDRVRRRESAEWGPHDGLSSVEQRQHHLHVQ